MFMIIFAVCYLTMSYHEWAILPQWVGPFYPPHGAKWPRRLLFYIGYNHLMVYVGSLLSGSLHLVMNKDHNTH